MRSYSTFAGAKRAAGSSPIIRLLADPHEIFVPIPDLETVIYLLTADSPRGPFGLVGRMTAMEMSDAQIAKDAWADLRIIVDAENPNNRRILNGRYPICKVYGFAPEEAQHKAEIIVAALGGKGEN